MKPPVTKAQKRILAELTCGRVICENTHGKKLSYFVANISPDYPCAYGYPRFISKRTVWALLQLGLITAVRAWKGYDKQVYVCAVGRGKTIREAIDGK